ncbi:CaiB/BaiF CoA transferase family protein [Microbacterium sp. Root61]|uniref:CaiB/BaiF CoA transferase family protein n=1 Tax=Microbacterium sp. Root61 TaxID=1736570 RepID=UPI0009E83906|nr:CoA transferase [Microbacterium sp. Root61]
MTVGALEGIKVVDLSRVLAGPYATMLLADFGADVVKVEPLEGDQTRGWRPPVAPDGSSTYFASVNRNKRSVTADLRDPDDVAAVRRLVAEADIVIENARSGAMEKLGFGYDALRADNPGLIYCSISGFGATEGAGLPGFDLLVQATGGLMSITGDEDGGPMKVGVALVDIVTGLHAVTGILAALHARAESGRGQRIEVNLLSSLLSALANQASAHLLGGAVPGRLGNAHPSIAPYQVVAAADRPYALAVGTDGQFRSLCGVLGRPELADDERFRTNTDRVRHRDELIEILEERLQSDSAQAWIDQLSAVAVPAGAINDIPEAFAFATRLGLAPVVEIDGAAQVANPIRFSETPVSYRSGPPPLGPRLSGADTSADAAQSSPTKGNR